MMNTILVTGGSGLVGNAIKSISSQYNYDFIFISSKDYNLLNMNETQEMFKKYNTFYVTDYKKEINDLHTENFSLSFLSKINS